MKKLLLILLLMFLSCFNSVFSLCAGWENPKTIRTYIEPNNNTAMMKQAFSKWTQMTNGRIVFKYVDSPKNAQIKVNFVKDASANTDNLEDAIGTTLPTYKYSKSGNIFLNTAEIRIASHVPGKAGRLMPKDRIYRVMIHEIGHAIGFNGTQAHSSDRQSVMYPVAVSRNQAITANDLKFLGQLYGW